MNDDDLTDAWEAGAVIPGGISHDQHVRIAWVLHRRHARHEALSRLLSGTERACEAHGCPEKFDAALTERWSDAVAEAIERDGSRASAAEFITSHPELANGELPREPTQRDGGALRVGVIGVGWAGRQHLAAYDGIAGVQTVALAGLEERVRAALAAQYRIERQVADWEDLLAVDGLDAVSVAVPTFLHAPIATAALQRGLHVLSEKPIARSMAEASAMVEAARAADRVLDVVFNHRRRGDIQELKRVIDAGRLGKPYYAKAWWLRRSGIPTLGSWFTRAELAGGGPLVDIGVHVLDYALFLLGNPKVTSVSASTYDLLCSSGFGASPTSGKTGAGGSKHFDVEDLATVFLRLDDGGTLLVEASWAAHRADGDEFGITLYGTEGGAELIVDDYEPVGSLRVFGDDGGVPVATRVSAKPGRGHDEVVEQFVEKVRSGRWAEHDGAGAAELAHVVDACYLSAAERREIRLT